MKNWNNSQWNLYYLLHIPLLFSCYSSSFSRVAFFILFSVCVCIYFHSSLVRWNRLIEFCFFSLLFLCNSNETSGVVTRTKANKQASKQTNKQTNNWVVIRQKQSESERKKSEQRWEHWIFNQEPICIYVSIHILLSATLLCFSAIFENCACLIFVCVCLVVVVVVVVSEIVILPCKNKPAASAVAADDEADSRTAVEKFKSIRAHSLSTNCCYVTTLHAHAHAHTHI